jgi:hypothetical protein
VRRASGAPAAAAAPGSALGGGGVGASRNAACWRARLSRLLLSPVVVRGRRCLRQPEPVCAGVMLADHWPGALSGTAAAAAPRRGVDVGAMDNGGGG